MQAYAAKFELPIRLSTNVTSLTRGNGTYVAKAGDEALEARQVVVATGPFHVPFIPPIDGSAAEFDAVVWATGFAADHSWIDVQEAKDDQGRIVHTRGVTRSPGLYALGLTWQHTRGSALLGWVGNDAAFLATQIAAANR